MNRPPTKLIGEFIEERTERLGKNSATIYSVTSNSGFVRSLDLFDKQVFSADTSNYKRVGANDLAYNPSRINVGSVAMYEDSVGGAVSPMYCIVRCKPGMHPRYLLHFLKSSVGLNEIRHRCEGAVRFQLKFRDLSAIPIYLPPLGEQERIVQLLDEADELRKLRTQADCHATALIPSVFHEMFGDPRASTNGLKFVTLDALCRKISDGTHKTPTYVASGVPFITVKNIVTGQLDFSDTKFISEKEHLELTKRSKPEPGDVLVSKDGTIGVPCPVHTDRQFSIFVSVALLKLKEELVDTDFLVSQLNMDWVQSQIREGTKGIAIRHLHLRDFRTLKLILPPLTLQREFAKRVAEIRALRGEQAASRYRLDDLFRSLLHSAFRGELRASARH